MTATRLIAYTPNGASLGPIPAPQDLSVGYPLNDIGALSLNYAPDAPRASLLGQPVELAVEVSWDKGLTWSEPASSRFLYLRDGRDPIKTGDAFAVEAAAYALRLQKVLVGFTGLNGEGNREFITQKPGAILRTLWDEAKARGALTGMTATWTATQDSNGTPWPENISQVAYEPGKDLLAILGEMVDLGLVDYRTQGRSVQVYVAESPDGMAADQTVGALPVSLRFGRDLTEAPFRRTWEGLADTAMVKGDNNSHLERTNAGALTPWGRQETYVTASGVEDSGTLQVIADAALTLTANERTEHTFGLEFGAAVSLPFRDYAPGEWVFAATDGGAPQRMRVRQITLTRDANGNTGGNVVLNDRFLEADVLQQRRLQKLTQGATQGGTGTTPGGGGIGPDILAPAKPTGLTAQSAAYVESDGRVRSQITVDWNDVTTNADNTVASDIDHYEVRGRQVGLTEWKNLAEVDTSTWSNSPYDPGEDWVFQVRAVDTVFNRGLWSDAATVTTSADNVGPLQPSTPVATTRLGTGRIAWDGLRPNGQAMDPDFAYVSVHVSQVNNFTATEANRIGELTGPGYAVAAPLSYNSFYYARLVPWDTSGNAGVPSAVAAFEVKPLVDISNFPDDAMEELFVRTGKFIQLSADNFSANLIEGSWVKAGAIGADKLTIGASGVSVLPNGNMEDQWTNANGSTEERPANWNIIYSNGATPGLYWETGSAISGNKSLLIVVPPAANGSTVGMSGVPFIPVVAGTSWHVRARIKADVATPGKPFLLRLHTSKPGTGPYALFTPNASWNVASQKDASVANGVVSLEGNVTIPAGHTQAAVSVGLPDVSDMFLNAPAEAVTSRYYNYNLREQLKDHIGRTVSVTVDLRTDAPTSISIYAYQASGISIGNGLVAATTSAWKTFTFNTVVTDYTDRPGLSNGSLAFYDSSDAGGNVYIRNLKIGPAFNLVVDAIEAYPAATDASITEVGAGKIKTGLLQATERIVTGSLTGARAEMNGVGFQAFDASGVKTFEVMGATGAAYFAGSVVTKATGAVGRVEITAANNPYESNQLWGSIAFYSSNPSWSPGLLWAAYGADQGVTYWGDMILVSPRLGSRAPATIRLRSEDLTNKTSISLFANQFTSTAETHFWGDPGKDIVTFRQAYTGSSTEQGFSFQSPGGKRINFRYGVFGKNLIESKAENASLTNLNLKYSGSLTFENATGAQEHLEIGSADNMGGRPSLRCFGGNNGLVFGGGSPGSLRVTTWNGSGYIPILASNFSVQSDSRAKTGWKPVKGALAALRSVPVYDYLTPHGIPRKSSDHAKRYRQRGVMAQDLQAVLPDGVHEDDVNTEKGDLSVDLYHLLGTAWAAIQEMAEELDTLKRASVTEAKDKP